MVNKMMNIEKDIKEEVKKAEAKSPEYNSYHEGFAIINEEVDEL
jgi:soluble cytochrome b562